MQFDVFGRKIIVKKVKNLRITHQAFGIYYPRTKHIEIDADLKNDEFMQTLIHELVHATLHRMGFENTSLSIDLEELIADKIPEMILENFTVKPKCKKPRK